MKKFFSPQAIAVVGASKNKDKIGSLIYANIKKGGFKGKLLPVNPKYNKIGSSKCYASVSEIKEKVDMAVIVIPAKFVNDVLEECGKNKIKNIVVISAGFSETGEIGKKRENEMKKIADKYELEIIGPNCLGIIDVKNKLNISFAPNDIPSGKISLISQSGSVATALIDLASQKNLGFAKIITVGNKTVISENELMQYLVDDKDTEIIALYLESIKNGETFQKIVKQASKKKPVIILKAGTSKESQEAVQSHTGAMSGEAQVIKTAITGNGAMYTENVYELIYLLKTYTNFADISDRPILTITNAGGMGVITTDLIAKTPNLEAYKPSKSDIKKWQKAIPEIKINGNPIDLIGDATSQRYEKILKTTNDNKNIGARLVIVTKQINTDVKNIEKIIKDNKKGPVIVPIFLQNNERANIPRFAYPQTVIGAMSKYIAWQRQKAQNDKERQIKIKPERQKQSMAMHQGTIPGMLWEYKEATKLLQKYEINTLRGISLDKIKDEHFPIVAKVDDPKIVHKKKSGAMIMNIKGILELRRAIEYLKNKFHSNKIILQPQIPKGLEIIIGVKYNKNFGHSIMMGLGGNDAEILDQKILWMSPATRDDIEYKIKGSKIAEIFEAKKIPINGLTDNVEKISQLVIENQWVKELDINPIMFYEKNNPIGIDVKIVGK